MLIWCSTANSLKIYLSPFYLLTNVILINLIKNKKWQTIYFIHFSAKSSMAYNYGLQTSWSLPQLVSPGLSQAATEPKWHLWLLRKAGSLWPEAQGCHVYKTALSDFWWTLEGQHGRGLWNSLSLTQDLLKSELVHGAFSHFVPEESLCQFITG